MDDFDQFERRLAAALRSDADGSVASFQPGAIAATAVSGAQRRTSRISRPFTARRAARLRPIAIAAVIGVMVVGGAFLMIQGIAPDLVGRPSPSPSLDSSPGLPGFVVPSASDLPAEPTASPVVNTTGVWVATGAMGTPRDGHIAVRLLDGRVLVAGGHADESALTSAELYDPVTGTWSATGDMIHPHGVFPPTLLLDGKVLVGDVIEDDLRDSSTMGAEVYDPVAGTWSATGAMVGPEETAGSMTATRLDDGTVLVTGLDGSQLYDPRTGTWTATGTMTTPRYNHTATLLPDGRVLVAGGDVPPDQATDSVELYDPDTGSWTATASLSATPERTRHVHPVAVLLADGSVLVVRPPTLERYDATTETWTATAESPVPLEDSAVSATLLSDGMVLMERGGVGGDRSPVTMLYDPDSDSWITTGTTARPRGWAAALLYDGTVLAAGGTDCLDGVCVQRTSADLYVPAGVPVPAHVGTHPEPGPTAFPTPTPVPTPYPPATGPTPADGRVWKVTVVNDSAEPATLFVAEEDERGMSRLVGSVTPNVVAPETTIEVTFLLPAADTNGWWIFVNPPTHGSLLGSDEVPRAGQIVIREDGQLGWLGL